MEYGTSGFKFQVSGFAKMAVQYRTQGFILTKEDLREADQVFSIFTRDFGKLKILGRAIRKIKSKLRPGAEIFYLSEIEFIQGKNYKTLTDALLIDKFKNIRQDLEKMKIACQIAEVADDLITGQEKDEKIWELLSEVFSKLDNCKFLPADRQGKLLYYYFLWNLFSILGYQIDFYHCVSCQKKILPEKLYLVSQGIICSSCSFSLIPTEKNKEVSPEAVKILRLFSQKDWQTIERLKIDDCYTEELESISENCLADIKNICNNLLNP